MERDAPPVEGVLETVLYFEDEEPTRAFYTEVLGFRVIGGEPGREIFLRAGRSVFLLFRASETRRPGGKVPPHGTTGVGHTCFLAPGAAYERWKEHLSARGVAVLQEVEWPRGRSLYFHDPAGNVLEIAGDDIWPP